MYQHGTKDGAMLIHTRPWREEKDNTYNGPFIYPTELSFKAAMLN